MTYTTTKQKFKVLPHSELLYLKSARIAWTIYQNSRYKVVRPWSIHSLPRAFIAI